MNISTVNVTFETISFLYFFNFTDEEFFNLSSQDFQNFQTNLTELGKFGFIIFLFSLLDSKAPSWVHSFIFWWKYISKV